ncbi:molecular chaperone DjlA [Marinobacter mobilis]|uniref:molecular chaperone DjlA n=1 Tax=Marinobacter mobilis TaxID=488533 RepID=UPI0035C7430A
MMRERFELPLPPRLESAVGELLDTLSACDHQASKLLARTGLPRWCRASLFFFLGYIAKAEGRVTEADIAFTESLIKSLKLSPRQRQRAIHQFQKGKQAQTLPAMKAIRLRLSQHWSPTQALKVAACLCHAAQLHGKPGKPRRHRCEDAVDYLGLDIRVVEDMLDSYACKAWPYQPENLPQPTNYEEACKVLGITRRDSLKSIKQTYRKRVSSCHPDKLPRGISATDLAKAKERLLRYQQSWDIVRKRHQASQAAPGRDQ